MEETAGHAALPAAACSHMPTPPAGVFLCKTTGQKEPFLRESNFFLVKKSCFMGFYYILWFIVVKWCGSFYRIEKGELYENG